MVIMYMYPMLTTHFPTDLYAKLCYVLVRNAGVLYTMPYHILFIAIHRTSVRFMLVLGL